MKKILFMSFCCLVLSGVAHGQNNNKYSEWEWRDECNGCEILLIGDREPTFYYWDTNWFDYKVEHYSQYFDRIVNGTWDLPVCKPEYARYCYTDSTLRIIGVAAAISIAEHRYIEQGVPLEDPYKNMETEYFSVYEVNSLSDSMHLVATAPWTNLTPRLGIVIDPSYMIDPGYSDWGLSPYGIPVYEVYFDSAVMVHDSFYVSVTENNNFNRGSYAWQQFYVTTGLWYCSPSINNPDGSDIWPFGPDPKHYRRRLHEMDPITGDSHYHVTDTNWHTFAGRGYFDISEQRHVPYFILFPIIDTSRGWNWQPECKVPGGLGTVYVSQSVVVLRWNSSNASQWELMLTPDGSEPDTTDPIICNSEIATIEGLDKATWYTACVRSVCDSTRKSEWSDTIRFFVPNDNTTNEIESTRTSVDAFTHIMPNPATDMVTVISSFSIKEIEFFTITGKSVMHQNVDAIAASFDISSLPTGKYLVRIQTSCGTSFKKMVKK